MIGIFDSGIGGLTILEACKKALPDTGFLYYGDHVHAPYGERSQDDIHRLTRKATRYMFDQGVDLVILACNTASAVALHDLQCDWLPDEDEGKGRRVLGVFVPMIEAMTKREWGDNTPPTHTGLSNVLLFATPATIASKAFARELRFRARDVVVEGVGCSGLVEAIEDNDHELVEKLVKQYTTSGLKNLPNPQTAALACTHYPMAWSSFEDALPKNTVIFSQAEIVAQSLKDYLSRHKHFANCENETIYQTSGDPKAVSLAVSKFIGKNIQFEDAKL